MPRPGPHLFESAEYPDLDDGMLVYISGHGIPTVIIDPKEQPSALISIVLVYVSERFAMRPGFRAMTIAIYHDQISMCIWMVD